MESEDELMAEVSQAMEFFGLTEEDRSKLEAAIAEYTSILVDTFSRELNKTWFPIDEASVHLIAMYYLIMYLAAKQGLQLPDDIGNAIMASGVLAMNAIDAVEQTTQWRLEDKEQIIVRTKKPDEQ